MNIGINKWYKRASEARRGGGTIRSSSRDPRTDLPFHPLHLHWNLKENDEYQYILQQGIVKIENYVESRNLK